MICAKCHLNVIDCTCDDIEERLKTLAESPNVIFDIEAIKARRFLNKFDIQRAKDEQNKPK